jgi:hypothetical protein
MKAAPLFVTASHLRLRRLVCSVVTCLAVISIAACDEEGEASSVGSDEDADAGSDEGVTGEPGGGASDAGGGADGSSQGDDDGWSDDDDGWSPPDCDPTWKPPAGATKPTGEPTLIEDPRCVLVEDAAQFPMNETFGKSTSTKDTSSDTEDTSSDTEDPPPEGDAGDPEETEVPLESCETIGAGRWCDESPGRQWCVDYAGGPHWSACHCEVVCSLDSYRECDGETCQQCVVDDTGVLGWVEVDDPFWVQPDDFACDPSNGPDTPIVVSFGGSFVMEEATLAAPTFGLGGVASERGQECVVSDWPTQDTPWLAMDRDGNGRIDDASELFGSGVRLQSGRFARHGFEVMAELDEDRSGTLDGRDPAFERLRLWRDDGDRVSQPDEITTLAASGITSLSVSWSRQELCDERGNCAREASTFEAKASTASFGGQRGGMLLDLHPHCVRREDTRLAP